MFAIHCPRHQARVLLGPHAIEALVNTPDGVVLHWYCHCGARGTLLTGHRTSAVVNPAQLAAPAA